MVAEAKESDNKKIYKDLNNELCVEELLHEAKKRPPLLLEEMLPAPGEAVLTGPEGTYAGEFVVPFLRKRSTSEALPATGIGLSQPAITRPSSSSWV